MPSLFSSVLSQARNRAASSGTAELDARLRAGEKFGTVFAKDIIARGKSLETQMEGLRTRFAADVANTGGERRRVRAGANSAAQAKLSGNRGGFSAQLGQALRRSKARQGITNRGEKAVENQALKDRITLARDAASRRGQLLSAASGSARLRSGLDARLQGARDSVNQAFAGAAGALAGGAVRGFGDSLFGGDQLGQGMLQQQNEVDFFLGTDPGMGGVEPISNTGVFA